MQCQGSSGPAQLGAPRSVSRPSSTADWPGALRGLPETDPPAAAFLLFAETRPRRLGAATSATFALTAFQDRSHGGCAETDWGWPRAQPRGRGNARAHRRRFRAGASDRLRASCCRPRAAPSLRLARAGA